MTDDELRELGGEFIANRKLIWTENAMQLDPGTIDHGVMRWDYIDPLRMGLYVLVKNAENKGCWVVDFDHISKVCTNPSAFKQAPPAQSARIGDFSTAEPPKHDPFVSGNEIAEVLMKGESVLLGDRLIEPPKGLQLLASIPDDATVDELVDF